MTDEQNYYVSTSRQCVSNENLKWKIKDLFALASKRITLQSPEFQLQTKPNCITLTFTLSKRDAKSYNKHCSSCNCHLETNTYQYSIDVMCSVTVPVGGEFLVNICINNEVQRFYLSDGAYVKDNKCITARFNLPLYNEIDICCNIKHYKRINQIIDKNKRECFLYTSAEKCKQINDFHENLEILYKNPMWTDVIIYVEGYKFEAHKIILASKSPVFNSMFTHQMRENLQNRVYIEEICPFVFEQFLYYVYTEKIRLSIDALDLIVVADRYGVDDLKTKCIDKIKSTMNVSNITRILKISNVLNDQSLKIKAFKYIAFNLKEVKATEDYKKFSVSDPHALLELYEYILA